MRQPTKQTAKLILEIDVDVTRENDEWVARNKEMGLEGRGATNELAVQDASAQLFSLTEIAIKSIIISVSHPPPESVSKAVGKALYQH